MNENITAFYTNLYDANNAISSLKSNGVKSANLNTTDSGLHIGYDSKNHINKFPGAVMSTMVQLEVNVDTENKDNAISVLEGSFGVIK